MTYTSAFSRLAPTTTMQVYAPILPLASKGFDTWRVCDSVGYIHIDDPVAVLRSEQIEPANKADRGVETPVEARDIRGQPEGLGVPLGVPL